MSTMKEKKFRYISVYLPEHSEEVKFLDDLKNDPYAERVSAFCRRAIKKEIDKVKKEGK